MSPLLAKPSCRFQSTPHRVKPTRPHAPQLLLFSPAFSHGPLLTVLQLNGLLALPRPCTACSRSTALAPTVPAVWGVCPSCSELQPPFLFPSFPGSCPRKATVERPGQRGVKDQPGDRCPCFCPRPLGSIPLTGALLRTTLAS